MYDALRSLIDNEELTVVEHFELPGRSAKYAKIPQFLFDSKIGPYLDHSLKESSGEKSLLWLHQAQALDALGRNDNVVVSTGTASGKSLIFRALSFHKVLLDKASRVLVFYPLKALAADQLRGWQDMARSLELDENIVARIDGSVSVGDREELLQRARIVVMTPDACHAWLMSRLAMPAIRNFIQSISTVVMDEAHVLESVFGSNFAFLLRRLIAARNYLIGGRLGAYPLQFIAATATIANPGAHMKQLTGTNFSIIDHEADGAPRYDRVLAHIACSEGDEVKIAKQLQHHVLTKGTQGGFITFLDSRKGVEGLALQAQQKLGGPAGDSTVLPYRAGYSVEDREEIEGKLQSGSLRGVISTSALELGIDLPHLRVGFNIGVPASRKAYRQRIGRVGRSGPGVFVVIGPPHAFSGYGTSFREYHEMSVEPSYLYLDNRFMQFSHGRCLADEREALGAPASLPSGVRWPTGFSEVYLAARPGGDRPREFDAVASLGADEPHYGYPLRNVGEVSYDIKVHTDAESFGEVNQHQALRECYPGATYLHMAKAYEVRAWQTRSFQPFIRVKRVTPRRSTRPKIRTFIVAGVTNVDLIENHFMRGENGFLAECQMQITERVDGFIDGRTGKMLSYRELQPHNPNMRAQMRNFRTSGIVLCIEQDWFRETSTKNIIADRLRDVFVREYSISPQDVGSAASNISVRNLDGKKLRGGCIAVFDQTHGSLRLTERLYLDFKHILDRLSVAATEPTGQGWESQLLSSRIRDEFSTFSKGGDSYDWSEETPEGYQMVFKPGSLVCYQKTGQMAVEVEVVQPTIMDGTLMYQVRVQQKPGQSPALQWINEAYLEPSGDGDAWDYVQWNRATQQYEDTPDRTES